MKQTNSPTQRMTLTHPLTKSALNQVLKDLMVKRESVGVITLKEFMNKTGCSLQASIDFLKDKHAGDFINGRRGHPSRYVFGKAQDKWIHQELIRAEWRTTNGRDPMTGRLLNTKEQYHNSPGHKTGQRMINVTVGDATVQLPVSLELVA